MNNDDRVNYKNSERVRRTLLAIATCFGGFITLVLMLTDLNSITTPFNLITGIAFLILTSLLKVTKLSLDKLYLIAFSILGFQFITTELLPLIIFNHTPATFYMEFLHTALVFVILTFVCFMFFGRIVAIKVSIFIASLTIITYLYCVSRLGGNLNLANLIEVIVYLVVCIFLTNALSLFQIEASTAKNDANLYERMAFFDELTGIANRRKLVETLQHEIAMSRRYNNSLSIIMFDIDHFKSVNDTYGHNIGDNVLQSVAASAKDIVRATDCFGRWGGEEFLCVLPNTTASISYELAERLRINLANTIIENGPQVTASFGIAQFSQSDDFDSFVKNADDALYSAKEQGRNCCSPKPLLQTNELCTNTLQAGLELN